MDWASYERVSNIVEETFFIWNEVVLTVEGSRKWTSIHFWQIFCFLRSFSLGGTFTSYADPSVWIGSNELCWLWKGDQYRRGKFLYLKRSSIVYKRFQRVHVKSLLRNFQLFEEFQYRSNFYFLWPTRLLVGREYLHLFIVLHRVNSRLLVSI